MSMTPARLGASSTWAVPRPVRPNSDTRTTHRICFRSLIVRSSLVQPFLFDPKILLESYSAPLLHNGTDRFFRKTEDAVSKRSCTILPGTVMSLLEDFS